MLGHFDMKPFSCNICSYNTKYASSLYRHVSIKHPDNLTPEIQSAKPQQMWNCDHCDYSTNFKWNLKAHNRKHNLEKQYKCPECNYQTAYRHNFIKHSKVHKEDEVFKCDKCPFVTKYEGHIQRHLAKIHNQVTEKANMCDVCDFSTKEKWRLNIHKQRSKQENTVKCEYCSFETYYTCESKRHKRGHYSEVNGTKGTINYDHLKDEIAALINAQKQENAEPPKEFIPVDDDLNNLTPYNKYLLDPNCVDWNTIQVLESDDKDRPFQCHMCTYTSKFKASVQRHFQRHHTGSKNRPYKCVNCEFSTKTKDQIALHNKRSQSELKLCCGSCSFTTFYKCQFALHQKCHYLYKCTSCNYSCKNKYELTKHYAVFHLGNGLKCQYCDFKAARKESLLSHETIHTGNKPFKCNFCDYSSVRRSLLENHLKRFHRNSTRDVTVVSESKIQELKVHLSGENSQNGIQEPVAWTDG